MARLVEISARGEITKTQFRGWLRRKFGQAGLPESGQGALAAYGPGYNHSILGGRHGGRMIFGRYASLHQGPGEETGPRIPEDESE